VTTEPSTAWRMICTGAVGALVQGGWGEWLTSMHRVWLTAMDWVGGCKVGWVCVNGGLWGELRGWVTVDLCFMGCGWGWGKGAGMEGAVPGKWVDSGHGDGEHRRVAGAAG
jgi:hypothetical protein